MMESSTNIHKTSVLSNAVKVMVINHKKDFLSSLGDFLKCHSFEVTCVDQVGAALKMLTEKKENFDLLLIDSDMRDVDTITFLRLTKSMDILSMVTCQEIDDNFVLEVIESGGFRVLKTPLTDEIAMQARQDVLRERFQKSDQPNFIDESETIEPESEHYQDKNVDGCVIKKNVKECYTGGISNGQLLESVGVKKKKYVRWTEEIHSKFLRAIHELGEGKCFPKDILDAMGVPGLTRLQVASHLQKCRLEVSKIFQRRGTPCSSSKKRPRSNVCHKGYLTAFGNVPTIATHVENHGQIVTDIFSTFPSNGGHLNGNNQSATDVPSNGQVYSVPTDFNHSGIPPNPVHDDFFNILNDNDENPSLECMELNIWGPDSNIISEQILPNHDQVMPDQETLDFFQHI